MQQDFFKFPRTPHLWWPQDRAPKDDRVLDSASVREFLAADVIVEEKVDGANLGLSLDDQGELRAQNRGSWVEHGSNHQFQSLWSWMSRRKSSVADFLQSNRIIFGEWCFAVHSVKYDRLPDWFLGFDIYDINSGGFWSTTRRNRVLSATGICEVPRLFAGRATLADLKEMLKSEQSRIGSGPVEGIYIRREDTDWLKARAKIVRPEFLSMIDEHWSRRPLKPNRLVDREHAPGSKSDPAGL